jgi:phosphonate transport system substrate-binding protein
MPGSPGATAFRGRAFQPTAGDTRRAYEPFFRYLADAVGRPYELQVATDWAGIAIALANEQADCAWMGPWGFVLAQDRAGAEALAVVHYLAREPSPPLQAARAGLSSTGA